MKIPDQFSSLALQPISPEMARAILSDTELIQEPQYAGVDLHTLVAAMQRPVAERIRGASPASVGMLELLVRANARFVLIGGLAGCAYGARFATKDLDICHARDPRNLEALTGVLRTLGAEFRRLPRTAAPVVCAETLSTEMDFVFTSRRGDIDLIGSFTGVGEYEQAAEDAVPIDVLGFEIQVLSLPKLSAAKLSTQRPKDVCVYNELVAIRQVMAAAYAGAGCAAIPSPREGEGRREPTAVGERGVFV